MNKGSLAANLLSQPADILDLILDIVPQGLVMVDSNYRTLAFNRPMFDIFCFPAGTLYVGKDFRDVIRDWAQHTDQDVVLIDEMMFQGSTNVTGDDGDEEEIEVFMDAFKQITNFLVLA